MLKDYLPEKPSNWDKSQKEWEEYWLSVLVCNSLNALEGECRIIGQNMDKRELEYYPITRQQIKNYERNFEQAQLAIHALMDRVKEFENIDVCDPDRAKCPWSGTWIPLEYIDGEWFEDDRLQDHYFYLVAHKKFATPMKAKYHDDGGMRHFQIMSVSNDICTRHNFDNVYSWDDSITHWMELPDLPEVEGVVFGDKKYWEDRD